MAYRRKARVKSEPAKRARAWGSAAAVGGISAAVGGISGQVQAHRGDGPVKGQGSGVPVIDLAILSFAVASANVHPQPWCGQALM